MDANDQPNIKIKVYARRWLMLELFVLYSIVASAHLWEFSIFNEELVEFLKKHEINIERILFWFDLYYILFTIPSIFLINKIGLRKMLLIASTGICIGCWLKLFAMSSPRYECQMVIIAQIIQHAVSILTFGVPALIAQNWFGSKETAMAGSLCLVGEQFGKIVGILIPPLVRYCEYKVNLRKMRVTMALMSSMILLFINLQFKSEPEFPPCVSRALEKDRKETVSKSICRVLTNTPFLIITFASSLCFGSFVALISSMREQISFHFQGATGGHIYLCFLISSMAGLANMIITGHYLDKTQKHKECAILFIMGTTISIILFTIAIISNNYTMVCIFAITIGFFILSFFAVIFQLCIEVTYPVSAGVSTIILFFFMKVFYLLFIYLYRQSKGLTHDNRANVDITFTFIVSFILTFFVPNNLKKREAEETGRLPNKSEEESDFISTTEIQ